MKEINIVRINFKYYFYLRTFDGASLYCPTCKLPIQFSNFMLIPDPFEVVKIFQQTHTFKTIVLNIQIKKYYIECCVTVLCSFRAC